VIGSLQNVHFWICWENAEFLSEGPKVGNSLCDHAGNPADTFQHLLEDSSIHKAQILGESLVNGGDPNYLDPLLMILQVLGYD